MKRSSIPHLLLAPDSAAGSATLDAQDVGATTTIVSAPFNDPKAAAEAAEEVAARTKRQEADDKRFAELTPAQLEEQRQEFMERVGFGDGKPKEKKVESPTDEEKAAADEKAKAEAAAAEKAKTDEEKAKAEKAEKEKKDAKPPVKKKPVAPTIDQAALQTAIVEGTKAAVQTVVDKLTPPKPPGEPALELAPKEKATIEVLKELESDARYAGIVDKTLKFWKKEEEYSKAWELRNEGKQFDPVAEEHAEFYTKNEPKFDEDDFDRAKEQVVEKRVTAKVQEQIRKQHEPEMERIKTEREYEKAMPVINGIANQSVAEFVAAAAPEFAKLMTVDGKIVLTDPVVDALVAADKDIVELLHGPAEEVRILVTELETLGRFQKAMPLDTNKAVKLVHSKGTIYPHRELLDFAANLEAELLALPAEETTRADGRTFLAEAAVNGAIKKIESGAGTREEKNAAIRAFTAKHWYIDVPITRNALIADRAAKMGKLVETLSRRGKPAAPSAGDTPPKPPEKPPEKPADKPAEKPAEGLGDKAPSTTDASDKTNTGNRAVPAGGISEENFNKKMGW